MLIHFPRSRGPDGSRRRRFLMRARTDPAQRRQLRSARLPAPHHWHRRGQPRRGRGAGRFHGGPNDRSRSRCSTKVALLGVGLIGSSMAHAMRRGGARRSHRGVTPSRRDARAARAAAGFADSLHGHAAACGQGRRSRDPGDAGRRLGALAEADRAASESAAPSSAMSARSRAR